MDTADINQTGESIVAIAAERREFDGLLRRAQSSREASLPIDFARHAEIDGKRWLLAANGPGPRLASRAAEAALTAIPARAVVSTGFCGAVDPAMNLADIFIATEVRGPIRSFQAGQPRCEQPCFRGALVSEDHVVTDVTEKDSLRAGGAMAVEMEAVAVAEAADRRALPFYCVRAVSDDSRTPMPLDFNSYRDDEGRFDRSRIARQALWRPWIWPRLLRLDQNCRQAADRLGEFLAHCCF
jgi:adenosylhomocysteine nucleosidase